MWTDCVFINQSLTSLHDKNISLSCWERPPSHTSMSSCRITTNPIIIPSKLPHQITWTFLQTCQVPSTFSLATPTKLQLMILVVHMACSDELYPSRAESISLSHPTPEKIIHTWSHNPEVKLHATMQNKVVGIQPTTGEAETKRC